MSGCVGENDALHGAALRGVLEYGDPAPFMPGEKGEVGICNRLGVRDDRGPGLMNGEGGMVMRGDSGRTREAASIFEAVDDSDIEVFVDRDETLDS